MIISGVEVLLDYEDEKRLSKYNYHRSKSILNQTGRSYFVRFIRINGKEKSTLLHRDVMYCVPGDKKVVDHKNGNTLDCRKENLRICTNQENIRNQKLSRNNTSGYKGVGWDKTNRKWVARIKVNMKLISLGTYKRIEDAANAYAEASKKYHGEFGRIR
jgi:hypothetical protein